MSTWNGDIATLRADAIVNAANAQMLGCFQPFHACIDNVIQCGAGPRLREDCAEIIRLQGREEPTGGAKVTRAYNLPSRFVIHTVGPIVNKRPLEERDRAALAASYKSVLDLAAETSLVKSIALCGGSTGIFGFPSEAAAQVALRTVSEWLENNPGSLEHIIFNTYGDAATSIYESAISEGTWRSSQ